MSLVANEQTKLTATYLNGLAIAILAVGGLSPIVTIVSGASQPHSVTSVAALTFSCLVLSVALHMLARRYLRDLQT